MVFEQVLKHHCVADMNVTVYDGMELVERVTVEPATGDGVRGVLTDGRSRWDVSADAFVDAAELPSRAAGGHTRRGRGRRRRPAPPCAEAAGTRARAADLRLRALVAARKTMYSPPNVPSVTPGGSLGSEGESSMRKRRAGKNSGGGLLGLALVAAACGGDDGGGGTTSGTVDEGVKAGVNQALAGRRRQHDGAGRPSPRRWRSGRRSGPRSGPPSSSGSRTTSWGMSADGKTVTGPEGFTIDLTKCPAGWSDTEGLTDTEIKIGHDTALSGTLADYGNIARAMEVLFDYYSAKGAFKDSTGKTRNVNFICKDDGYDPARTIPLVDELIDSEKVFAMWTAGLAHHAARPTTS